MFQARIYKFCLLFGQIYFLLGNMYRIFTIMFNRKIIQCVCTITRATNWCLLCYPITCLKLTHPRMGTYSYLLGCQTTHHHHLGQHCPDWQNGRTHQHPLVSFLEHFYFIFERFPHAGLLPSFSRFGLWNHSGIGTYEQNGQIHDNYSIYHDLGLVF